MPQCRLHGAFLTSLSIYLESESPGCKRCPKSCREWSFCPILWTVWELHLLKAIPVPQHVCEMLLVTPVSVSQPQSMTVPPLSPCTCFRLVSLPCFKEKINFLGARPGETGKLLEGVTAPKLLLTQQLQVPRSGDTAEYRSLLP